MPDRVRLRASPWSYLPGLALLLVIGATAVAQGDAGEVLPGLVMVPLAVAAFAWWPGITLTQDEAVVHDLGRIRLLWRDVQAVTQEPVMGLWFRIVIYSTSHGRIVLRTPTAGPAFGRGHFDKAFHTIGQWWVDHRGADWRPLPVHRYPWAAAQSEPVPGDPRLRDPAS